MASNYSHYLVTIELLEINGSRSLIFTALSIYQAKKFVRECIGSLDSYAIDWEVGRLGSWEYKALYPNIDRAHTRPELSKVFEAWYNEIISINTNREHENTKSDINPAVVRQDSPGDKIKRVQEYYGTLAAASASRLQNKPGGVSKLRRGGVPERVQTRLSGYVGRVPTYRVHPLRPGTSGLARS